jgi:hypothetical protein
MAIPSPEEQETAQKQKEAELAQDRVERREKLGHDEQTEPALEDK